MGRRKHEQRVKTSNPDIDCCYTQTPAGDGFVKLEICAVYSEKYAFENPEENVSSSEQVSFIPSRTEKKLSKVKVNEFVNNYCGTAANLYFKTTVIDIKEPNASKGRIRSAFEFLKKSKDNISPTWNASVHTKMVYFERHVLSYLELFENRDFRLFLKSDKLELFNQLFDFANSREFKDKKKTEVLSKAAAAKHMNESNLIYQRIRVIDAQTHRDLLPVLDLSIKDENAKRLQAEQVKFLSDKMRKAFQAEIEKDIEEFPELVLAATAMRNGARTSEAAALNPHYFIFRGEYAVMIIDAQEFNGERVKPKTPDSYRQVPLDNYSRFVFEKCCALILAKKPDYSPDSPIADSNVLSFYVKEKLIAAGAKNVLTAAEDELNSFDGNFEIQETLYPEAYILRRDYATVLKFICGVDCDTIDRFLGHKPFANKKVSRDKNLEDSFIADSKLLNRRCSIQEISLCSKTMSKEDTVFSDIAERIAIINDSLLNQELIFSIVAENPNSCIKIDTSNPDSINLYTNTSNTIDWKKKKRAFFLDS